MSYEEEQAVYRQRQTWREERKKEAAKEELILAIYQMQQAQSEGLSHATYLALKRFNKACLKARQVGVVSSFLTFEEAERTFIC
jgi:hypothetical protein